MMVMAATPEEAMTLAQLGMRLKRTGTMASAPWSNLFPRTDERLLNKKRNRFTKFNINYMDEVLLNHLTWMAGRTDRQL